MDVSYTNGPRILEDGTNLDADIFADFPRVLVQEITDPVTNLAGPGYEPGQQNKDGSPL